MHPSISTIFRKGKKMKKLIVVLMVLSMATMANAALVLSISGPSSLLEGQVGTYTVSYSWNGMPSTGSETLVSADTDIVSDLGSIGRGVILTTNRDTNLDIVGMDSLTGNYEVLLINDVANTDFGFPYQLFSFTLTAPAANGTAHIRLLENSYYDENWNQITSSDLILNGKTVTIIPEPITVTLLGLGGLFLRRRK